MIRWTRIESPLGELLVARDDVGLTHLYLPGGRHPRGPHEDWQRDDTAFDDVRSQLAEYFAGERTEFDLPLHATGTAFQRRVWQALCDIPYGQTASYGATATAVGVPVSASRAIGAANGMNPISIIVPCHRVIGANGSLTGYGGGIEAKRWLLGHESAQAAQPGLFV
jgi:methylated-DNA-[protein]-cysteine S-methyltransferase